MDDNRGNAALEKTLRPSLSSTPHRRSRDIWCGFLLIALFALGYLQLGLVHADSGAANSNRVNDGREPTFFAFHIDPYGVTSEDFHLYVVRSKRILDRGWTNSPLTRRHETGRSYLAPLQALLGMVAVQTGGRPLPYSVFMASVLLLGWGTLYFASIRFLPDCFSVSTIVLAVMTSVLFESLQDLLIEPELCFGIWPIERNLRLSTVAWTTPLTLASIVACVSLWFRPERRREAIVFTGAALAALGAADNWAFGYAWLAAGLATGGLALGALRTRKINQLAQPAALALVLGASFGLQAFWSRDIQGDGLARGGFGPRWLGMGDVSDAIVGTIREWWMPWGIIPLAVIVVSAILGCMRLRPKSSDSSRRLSIQRDEFGRVWCAAIAILSVVAGMAMIVLLSRGGMEEYLRFQVYWRLDVVILFTLVLSLAATLNQISQRLAAKWPRFSLAYPITIVVLLGALFTYHQYRIHWFATNVVANDYYLTADAEKLRDWLQEYESEKSTPYSLATLSPELNYLCAYWTDADLLLPSGFPYHNLDSNEHIHEAVVDLLRLYCVNRTQWLAFNKPLPRPNRFCEYWRQSRVRAAGAAYIYHIYHRAFKIGRHTENNWRKKQIHAVARELSRRARRSVPVPEIILIDSVSRELGKPNLENYQRAFKTKTIEAWVLKEDIE